MSLPEILNNSFSSNTALLSGNDIASYPQRIKILSQAEYHSLSAKISEWQSATNRYTINSTALSTEIAAAKAAFLATRQLLGEEEPHWHSFVAPDL